MTETKLAKVQPVLDELLKHLNASRITLRTDVEGMDYPVMAEAEAPGVPTIAHLTEIGQRDADTVKWIGREQRVLVVNDANNSNPTCPAEMTSEFNLKAFILVPLGIQANGSQVGWISVHVNEDTRDWSQEEVSKAESAGEKIKGILGNYTTLSTQNLI